MCLIVKNFSYERNYCKSYCLGLNSSSVQRKSCPIANPGLVDFSIRLVIFVLNLPVGQVLSLGEIQITEGL